LIYSGLNAGEQKQEPAFAEASFEEALIRRKIDAQKGVYKRSGGYAQAGLS
jgi:hypothetical protein